MTVTSLNDTDNDINPFNQHYVEPQRKLCSFPVKHGVTYWNVLAIIMVPCCMMIIATYLSAQVIFLLANPDYFNVPKG